MDGKPGLLGEGKEQKDFSSTGETADQTRREDIALPKSWGSRFRYNFVRKGWEKLRQFTPSGFHFLGEMDTSLPISGKG